MARRLLLERVIMAKTKKQWQAQEQKLLDAVSYAASCLKEAGDPLHGLGPSLRYADAFDRYGRALKDLVAHECPLHVAEWCWNGYDGTFDFCWEFSAQLAQPAMRHDHDTKFLSMRCAGCLNPEKPLLEELARLRAEARHYDYDELRSATMRWAHSARKESSAAVPRGEEHAS
jgi:hypothetical protein